MTSASELFYTRRSRFGRNSDPFGVGADLDSPPPPDRTYRRNRQFNSPGGSHARRDRLEPDGCDPFRRSIHQLRQPPPHRRPSHPPQEHEPIRLEEVGHQISPGNVSHTGNHVSVRDRARVNGNDRLPGPVLLARERLLQRLRGVTLSGSRRNNRSLSNNIAIGEDFRLVDAGDWETEISRDWVASVTHSTDSIAHQTSSRPPGLTQEALTSLRIEIFSLQEKTNAHNMSRDLKECSICLESFSEGEKLTCLPCGHRYHFCCLGPWVRTCGDCPYCRRSIYATVD
ncbi:hypothetical protein ACP275_02G041300 [Erythranthe tilingii]